MKLRAVVATLFIAACTLNAPAQTSTDRESLRGITKVRVIYRVAPDKIKEHGIDLTQVDTDIKLKLRKSGISVIEPENDKPADYDASLVVSIQVLTVDASTSSFAVTLSLQQWAYLTRTSQPAGARQAVYATTWDRGGGIGSSGPNDIRRTIREMLSDSTDRFLNDYLAVNPNLLVHD